MKKILYDYYGIYVDQIERGRFIFQGKHYLFIESYQDEKQIYELNYLYSLSFKQLQRQPYFILIENRYHQVKTFKYVLYQLSFDKIALEDLIPTSMQFLKIEKGKVLIDEWILLMDQVENEVLPTMKEEKNFDYAYALVSYTLGLAENALAYLQDYNFLTQYYFCSLQIDPNRISCQQDLVPTQYFFSHYLDFLASLYQNNFINLNFLNFYMQGFSELDYVYFYARVLFPKSYFKFLISQFDSKQLLQVNIKYYRNIDLYEQRIKELYGIIKQKINIRQLEWLE